MEKQSEAHRLADTPFALRDGRWNFQADDELRRLYVSEREGWRYADELEQERKRLEAVIQSLTERLEESSSPIYMAEVTMPDPDIWCHGKAECLNCGHEWTAVWPLAAESLECPRCGSTDTDRDQAGPHTLKTR